MKLMKKNFIIIFITFLFIGACRETIEQPKIAVEEEVKPTVKTKPVELPNDLFYYRLTSLRSEIDLRPYNYFGSFFSDRLRFYHLKQPGINFRGADVKEIYLYFIDDYLVKVRYEFTEDILAKITDYMQGGNPNLNETLRINWDFPNRRVMYSRTPLGETHNYFLYEEVYGYKQLVRDAGRTADGVIIKSSIASEGS
jgi:hypothetical protein